MRVEFGAGGVAMGEDPAKFKTRGVGNYFTPDFQYVAYSILSRSISY